MAIRSALYSGSDFTDEPVPSADMNDTFDEVITRGSLLIDSMTKDSTANSETSDNTLGGGTAIKSYTFTPEDSNNMMLFIKVTFDAKTDSGISDSYIYGQITNDTTSEIAYFGETSIEETNDEPFPTIGVVLTGSYVSQSATCYFSSAMPTSAAMSNGALALYPAMAMGTSYTIKFYGLFTDNSAETVYMDEVEITVGYISGVVTTTGSAKFS